MTAVKNTATSSGTVVSNAKSGTATHFDPALGAYFDDAPETAAKYNEGLYQPGGFARSVPDLDVVGAADLKFYAEEGYLTVTRAYSPAEVEAAIAGLVNLVSGRRPGFQQVIF